MKTFLKILGTVILTVVVAIATTVAVMQHMIDNIVMSDADGLLKVEKTFIRVPLYKAEITKDNQDIVDMKHGAAWIVDAKDKNLNAINDHSTDGFWQIDYVPIGTTATIELKDGSKKTITLVHKERGVNTRKGIVNEKGEDMWHDYYENNFIMSTCADETGINVIVTYWI